MTVVFLEKVLESFGLGHVRGRGDFFLDLVKYVQKRFFNDRFLYLSLNAFLLGRNQVLSCIISKRGNTREVHDW